MCLHQYLFWSAYSYVIKKIIVLLISLHFLPFFFFRNGLFEKWLCLWFWALFCMGFLFSTFSLFVSKFSLTIMLLLCQPTYGSIFFEQFLLFCFYYVAWRAASVCYHWVLEYGVMRTRSVPPSPLLLVGSGGSQPAMAEPNQIRQRSLTVSRQ